MLRWLGSSAALLVVSCASYDPIETSPDVGGYESCNTVIREYAVPSAAHVAECSPLDDSVKPPYGGPHYPVWAAFQTYSFPVPHGYLLHSMEHGAVVFYYNCPNGCDAEVAEAQALIDSQRVDPLCEGTGVDRRAILVPDPTLDVAWGASAWGYNLRADCFDRDLFLRFYVNHYGRAPEDFCSPGVPFVSPPCPEP